jgi:hypothetical protein
MTTQQGHLADQSPASLEVATAAVEQHQAVPRPSPVPSRSPSVAVILSLCITGLGHIYAGHVGAGLAWFFGGIVAAIMTGFLAAPFIWVGAAMHAYSLAKRT